MVCSMISSLLVCENGLKQVNFSIKSFQFKETYRGLPTGRRISDGAMLSAHCELESDTLLPSDDTS